MFTSWHIVNYFPVACSGFHPGSLWRLCALQVPLSLHSFFLSQTSWLLSSFILVRGFLPSAKAFMFNVPVVGLLQQYLFQVGLLVFCLFFYI